MKRSSALSDAGHFLFTVMPTNDKHTIQHKLSSITDRHMMPTDLLLPRTLNIDTLDPLQPNHQNS